MLNKQEIKDQLIYSSAGQLENYDLKTLEELKDESKYTVVSELKSKRLKIEKLLLEIEILEEEEKKIDTKINELESSETKNVIEIKEVPKQSKNTCYYLYIKLLKVDKNTNKIISIIDDRILDFKERGKFKDELITGYISNNNIQEIWSNMWLDKLEKTNILEGINVINSILK
jgi:hypothetical protein